MPEVTDNGQTYTFKVRKGVYFTPDPAFKGVKRELVAEDFAFSLKRLVDPAIHSPWAWLVEGKIVGLDDAGRQRRRRPASSTTTPRSPGSRSSTATRCASTSPSPTTTCPTCSRTSRPARSRGKWSRRTATRAGASWRTRSAPAPTGSSQWVRSSKIVLEANPDYRGFVWDFQPGADPDDARIVAEMKGKKMPQIGRIEISIMEEDQSRLLAFQNGELDLMNMEGPLAPKVLNGGTLTPDLAEEGRPAVALRRSGNHLHVLEPDGSRRRRAHAGEDRAAPRDGDVLSGRRGDQGHPQRPGDRGEVPGPARAWSAAIRRGGRA